MHLKRSFALTPAAPGAARRSLLQLRPRVSKPVLEDLRLIVSELVTNSLKHSSQDVVTIAVQVSADRVRLEVSDLGGGFTPHIGPGSEDLVSGWGLFLVQRVSDRWGLIPDDGVWAEIDLGTRGSHAA
jgi:anti-sigma regulatory factor (Ser/Thr protein kinase)